MNTKITMGISMPNNLHALVSEDGSFSRVLKVNSKENFLEYLGLLNEVYRLDTKEEEYRQRIMAVKDIKVLKKYIKLAVFIAGLIPSIFLALPLNIGDNILTIKNILNLLIIILGNEILASIISGILYGTNKKINKREEHLQEKYRKIRHEKQELITLCKEKEYEFKIKEVGLDISYRIENSINRNYNPNERWYIDTYKEDLGEVNIYRMREKALDIKDDNYYSSLNRNIIDKLNHEEEIEEPSKIIGIKSLRR